MIFSLIDTIKNNKLIISLMIVVILIVSMFVMWGKKAIKGRIKAKNVAIIGIFTAFSVILYFLKFNLPFIFPSFLEINFSLLPIIIIGFMYGPVEGLTVVFLRTIIKIPFTSTFCVGEIADLLIGTAVILVTSIIYSFNHTKKGALISLLLGVFTWIFAGVITNMFINIPFFVELYFNGNIEIFITTLSVIPGVTVENYMLKYILYACIPFNALISIVVCTITMLVYKKISFLVNKEKYEKIKVVEGE